MTAKQLWSRVEVQLKKQGLTITELASLIGKSRNTLFSQRKFGYMPKADQIKKMEEVLGCKLLDENEDCMEYLPYLRKAEDWQLRSVRQILNMPPLEEDGNFIQEVN